MHGPRRIAGIRVASRHSMIRRDAALTAGGMLAGTLLAATAIRRRRAIQFEGRVVMITGGSRGLGLLLARELGRLGARVVLVARDEAELERAQQDLRTHEIDATILTGDVTVREQAQQLVDGVVKEYARLDVLINNAGVITVGPSDDMAQADFKDAMATHFWGPLHMMQAAIPHMREAGGGRIANVSSIGGKIGVPHLVPYCASKFALTGLSTAMRAELAPDGIVITTISPGLMRTGSPFNAWFKGQHRQEFAWFAISDSLPLLSINGRRAAAQIVDAIRHGDPELVITWPARLAVAVSALLPNATARAIGLIARALPAPGGRAGSEGHSGWQSSSAWAPSVLTRTSERAAAENNEIPPGHSTV
jgi:NAD(P)-dependent dehydrogenase (short-subunit alcohol dehydrogenase family)